MGTRATADDFNRAYGLDLAWQASPNGKLFAFIARTDSPTCNGASDHAGRINCTYANAMGNGALAFAQVGERFNPEVGFLPRRAFRQFDSRYNLTYQPKQWPWIRRISPHANFTAYTELVKYTRLLDFSATARSVDRARILLPGRHRLHEPVRPAQGTRGRSGFHIQSRMRESPLKRPIRTTSSIDSPNSD